MYIPLIFIESNLILRLQSPQNLRVSPILKGK